MGAAEKAPTSHPLLGWLPAVLPASALRVRVIDPGIADCLDAAGAEIVQSKPDVEIENTGSVSGEAQCVIVSLTGKASRGRSTVIRVLRRVAGSIAVGLRAKRVRWNLRHHKYSSVEVLRWDLGHTLRLSGEWTPRRLRTVEFVPLGALVVAHRDHVAETVLDRALAAAQEALEAPLRPSWPFVRGGGLVVLGSGAVLRVAVGPARHQLELQRRALQLLQEARPTRSVSMRVPWHVAHGEAGLGEWMLEKRLPGSPSPPVLSEPLLSECVEFLVDLYAAGKGASVGPTLDDRADVPAFHTEGVDASSIRSLARSSDAVLADVPRGFAHGDFWTENLLTESGRLVAVVDWAAAAPGRLPLLDLVHLRLSARRWSKHEDIGTTVLNEMRSWARKGGDPWTHAYCRGVGLLPDRARLEAFLIAYWLERVALELETYSDRATEAWLEANVRRVSRALIKADLAILA